MEDSIKQLQGSLLHTGKSPVNQNIESLSESAGKTRGKSIKDETSEEEKELSELDSRLKEALRFEDYETAAVCRDRIKEIRKGNETNA